jgi:hypothetical protein
MQWVKDGAVPATEALEQDASTCRQHAWREAQYNAWAYRPYGWAPYAGGRPFIGGWPYGAWGYPFSDPFFEEARLTDFCMRAKGYELVPIEKSPPVEKPPA